AESGRDRIGRITTAGEVKGFAVGGGYRQLQGIAAGPDGNVWFTETHANTVSRHTLDRSSAEAR
ncbi:MAG TPA: virginiamycin B lyase, partial [Acidimicrobiia bacterium]|nr:virginiamycin B lyase [Acidimicrobiia bacterium]